GVECGGWADTAGGGGVRLFESLIQWKHQDGCCPKMFMDDPKIVRTDYMPIFQLIVFFVTENVALNFNMHGEAGCEKLKPR
ncbi:MAG: hypothetical protein R8M11_08070, partial [Gallionella sp.]